MVVAAADVDLPEIAVDMGGIVVDMGEIADVDPLDVDIPEIAVGAVVDHQEEGRLCRRLHVLQMFLPAFISKNVRMTYINI